MGSSLFEPVDTSYAERNRWFIADGLMRVEDSGWSVERRLEYGLWSLPDRPWSDLPVVYFIQGDYGGPVKIGVSRWAKLDGRVASLQTGHPWPLVVRKVFHASKASESALHCLFGEQRLNGEWFLASDDLRSLCGAAGDDPDGFVSIRSRSYERGRSDGYYEGLEAGKRLAFHDVWLGLKNFANGVLDISERPYVDVRDL